MFPTLSAKGDRLAFTKNIDDQNQYKLPLAGPGEAAGAAEPFAHSNAGDINPDISMDGSKVASGQPARVLQKYTRRTAPDRMLYVSRRCIRSSAVAHGSSQDGKLIVVDSRQSGGQSDIFVMSATGGLPRNLSNHTATDAAPTWSRDGRFIYFHSDRSGSSQVWKMGADGTNPTQITQESGVIAYESVDGAAIFSSEGRYNHYIPHRSLDSPIERWK